MIETKLQFHKHFSFLAERGLVQPLMHRFPAHFWSLPYFYGDILWESSPGAQEGVVESSSWFWQPLPFLTKAACLSNWCDWSKLTDLRLPWSVPVFVDCAVNTHMNRCGFIVSAGICPRGHQFAINPNRSRLLGASISHISSWSKPLPTKNYL